MTVSKRKISRENGGLQNIKSQDQNGKLIDRAVNYDDVNGEGDGNDFKRRKIEKDTESESESDEDDEDESESEDVEFLDIPEGFDEDEAYKNIINNIRQQERGYKISERNRYVKYDVFVENESKPFAQRFDPVTSELQSSYITNEGSYIGLAPQESRLTVGTFWSNLEKEIFFEYLARYGSRDLNKICKHLPNKSILEIEMYYKLLDDNLQYFKNHKSKFLKLIKYEEIPIAIEVDDITLAIEEQIVFKNEKHDKSIRSKLKLDETRDDFSLRKALTNDDEDQLINTDALNSLCSFYQMDHLFEYGVNLKSSSISPNLGDCFKNLEMIIKNYTRDILKQIIETSIYDNISFKIDQDKLVLPVNLQTIKKAILQKYNQRPIGLREYMESLHDRLNFDIMSDEGTKFTFLTQVPIPKHYNKKLRSLTPPMSSDEEVELLKCDDSKDMGFIVDDKDDDSIMDNKLALKLFYKETSQIESIDLEKSRIECNNLLSQWGALDALDKIELNWLKWKQSQIKQFNKKQKKRTQPKTKIEQKHESYLSQKPIIHKDPTLQQIMDEIDHDTSLHVDSKDEITDEMMLLYSHTFD